jgi:hypothetical protein
MDSAPEFADLIRRIRENRFAIVLESEKRFEEHELNALEGDLEMLLTVRTSRPMEVQACALLTCQSVMRAIAKSLTREPSHSETRAALLAVGNRMLIKVSRCMEPQGDPDGA